MKKKIVTIPARLVLSKRLNSILKERKIKQEDFAKKVGISVSSLKKYLDTTKSSPTPSIDVVRAMAAELSVSTDYLIGATNFAPAKNRLTVTDVLRHLIVVLDHTDLTLEPNVQTGNFALVSNNKVISQFLKDYYQSQRKWLTPDERSAARNQLLEGSTYQDCLIYKKSFVSFFDFFFERFTNYHNLSTTTTMQVLGNCFEILRIFQKENQICPGGPVGLSMEISPSQIEDYKKIHSNAKTDEEVILAICESLDQQNLTANERKLLYLSRLAKEKDETNLFAGMHGVDPQLTAAVANIFIEYLSEYSEEALSDEFDYFPF